MSVRNEPKSNTEYIALSSTGKLNARRPPPRSDMNPGFHLVREYLDDS